MRIKHYIVTYKNNDLLRNNLDSVQRVSVPEGIDYSVTVINNFERVYLPSYMSEIAVINNDLRLDTSTGHLSRNWNQGLLLGFKNLVVPDADIVILSQNDTEVLPNFLSTLLEAHGRYDFIVQGIGDAFHSYTANAIRRVGLWDERFCGIGFQEYDYFYRSLLLNYHKTSCEVGCGEQYDLQKYNMDVEPCINFNVPTGYDRKDESHLRSMKHHDVSSRVLCNKYGLRWSDNNSSFLRELFTAKHEFKIDSYFTYPYFEKDINRDSLIKQRYSV